MGQIVVPRCSNRENVWCYVLRHSTYSFLVASDTIVDEVETTDTVIRQYKAWSHSMINLKRHPY
jgi:hypothetical protein